MERIVDFLTFKDDDRMQSEFGIYYVQNVQVYVVLCMYYEHITVNTDE